MPAIGWQIRKCFCNELRSDTPFVFAGMVFERIDVSRKQYLVPAWINVLPSIPLPLAESDKRERTQLGAGG
jgi:hypothetical protein